MEKSEKTTSSEKKSKIRNDFILAAVIVIMAAAGLLLVNLTKEQGNTLVVKIDGTETASYSLSADTSFEIRTGKNGENVNVVVIEGGKAHVSEADCPDGICKDYRPVSYVGETIVCLPHKLVLEVTGEKADGGLDIVS
ncbi:MAG: NusG domain II-containing protein [Clostridia bacterium]|nr:NusG domain II-containing protein [Clostridia bacterium]